MPPRKMGEEDKAPAPTDAGADGMDALPDDVLRLVLSFLPAQEAVRTCVLASRWRHLWKSAPGLRIMGCDERVPAPVKELCGFVDHLLLRRGHASLETCDFRLGYFDNDDNVRRLGRWIGHVVMCQVQTLRLRVCDEECEPWLDSLSLVSRHLTRLELAGVGLYSGFCDFSGCPSLEHLGIAHCDLCCVNRISSDSLKCLSITSCSVKTTWLTFIYVPSLVSLRLADSWDPDDKECHGCFDVENHNNDVLMEVLSETDNLALISESEAFGIERYLKWCPPFRKLKTVLLDHYWCVAPDFQALTCILNNTPVLEKLILQLFPKGSGHKFEMIGRCNFMERSGAISSEHLKAIKVKFEVFDEDVRDVLKYLCTLNIYFIVE
uniref:F-box domain-containing protein n=1 Tax=Arundo donax TaxID=35708 RepID=A0A0A9FAF1_ARUDO